MNLHKDSIADIDVIIPTRNRAEDLIELLKLLLRQEVKPKKIIIIDDGDFDQLHKRMRAHGIFLLASDLGVEVLHIRGSRKGLTGARNLGLKIASSNVIIFFDDDIIIPRDFLRHVHEILKTFPDVAGLTGHIINVFNKSERDGYKIVLPNSLVNPYINSVLKILKLQHYENKKCGISNALYPYYPIPIIEKELIKSELLPGAFICLRRKLINKYNLKFDENLRLLNSPLEDVDFSIKMKRSQLPVYMALNLIVFHKKRRPSFSSIKNTVITSAMYRMYLISKHYRSDILRYFSFLLALLAEFMLRNLQMLLEWSRPHTHYNEERTTFYWLHSIFLILKNIRLFLRGDIEAINERLEKLLQG